MQEPVDRSLSPERISDREDIAIRNIGKLSRKLNFLKDLSETDFKDPVDIKKDDVLKTSSFSFPLTEADFDAIPDSIDDLMFDLGNLRPASGVHVKFEFIENEERWGWSILPDQVDEQHVGITFNRKGQQHGKSVVWITAPTHHPSHDESKIRIDTSWTGAYFASERAKAVLKKYESPSYMGPGNVVSGNPLFSSLAFDTGKWIWDRLNTRLNEPQQWENPSTPPMKIMEALQTNADKVLLKTGYGHLDGQDIYQLLFELSSEDHAKILAMIQVDYDSRDIQNPAMIPAISENLLPPDVRGLAHGIRMMSKDDRNDALYKLQDVPAEKRAQLSTALNEYNQDIIREQRGQGNLVTRISRPTIEGIDHDLIDAMFNSVEEHWAQNKGVRYID